MTPTVRSVRRALRTLGVEAEVIRIVAYDGDWYPDLADVERWLDLPVRAIGLMAEVDEIAELARQDALDGRTDADA